MARVLRRRKRENLLLWIAMFVCIDSTCHDLLACFAIDERESDELKHTEK